jgi:phage FluMu protein gp41
LLNKLDIRYVYLRDGMVLLERQRNETTEKEWCRKKKVQGEMESKRPVNTAGL